MVRYGALGLSDLCEVSGVIRSDASQRAKAASGKLPPLLAFDTL